MSLNREQRRAEVERAKCDANEPKSALIRILSRIESYGSKEDARALSVVIGKLEAWQNRGPR